MLRDSILSVQRYKIPYADFFNRILAVAVSPRQSPGMLAILGLALQIGQSANG
jgi:hypothetical protein